MIDHTSYNDLIQKFVVFEDNGSHTVIVILIDKGQDGGVFIQTIDYSITKQRTVPYP